MRSIKQGARWTETEIDRLRTLIADGKSSDEIAETFGRTKVAISAKVQALKSVEQERLGVTPKRQNRRVSGAAFFLS